MAINGGWSGTILRVDLTSGKITRENTEKYIDYIGGMGFGYKIMWDEVPAGTKAFDPENKIIFGAGPLTGSGAISSGRTNITSLLASNPFHGVTDSHMGGHFSVEMKYAGYDAIILEGKSPYPVWLRIEDDQVSLEDASLLWGESTTKAMMGINAIMGSDAQVAVIGQAGENMVPLSIIRTGPSHSAGGHGGVMGSKRIKGIGVKGTGAVHMTGDSMKWYNLNKYTLSLFGANNNHVVPREPQPWAEYSSPGSRWTAKPGLFWEKAETPIETGYCTDKEPNKIGYRTMKAMLDLGASGPKYTVRMGGCAACPIRCHSHIEVPQLENYGIAPYVANTCMGYYSPAGVMFKGFHVTGETDDDAGVIGKALGSQLADDYGVWCNYGQIGRDLQWTYEHGILKKVIPAAEYASIPWDLLEKGDPAFYLDFYPRIAMKRGELSHLGDGAYAIAQRWNLGEEYWAYEKNKLWTKIGYPVHHSNEANGQVGALISSMFNRDAQCHTHMNLIGSGLPMDIQKEIAGEIWGSPDAMDPPAKYTPMNQAKARMAKWSIIRNVLHDSLTLCNWMWPMMASPQKERGYRGDTTLESVYYSQATGIETTEAELDAAAERIFNLHRALTVKQMGTTDMRTKHDRLTGWQFEMNPDKAPFSPGTVKLDREDFETALTMFYTEMGWDPKTGAPTRKALEASNLRYVADELEVLGLLPA